ncbi:MAG TPA: glycoside hydrolase family 15 protein [Burkholderiaceae bacterium]|nr:glycoside hydrolase family 15 protein [Burkholderiaceae bacterium]
MNATTQAEEPAVRAQRLAGYCAQAESIILARQDVHTGLLPASTATTVHGDYTHAWVRDNVYSILAPWALALACRKVDPARAQALDERVTHLMRGLLAAMMRQSAKVERFKRTQDPLDALHAKYDTRTGEPVVGDTEWGHLQLDATAIFLLFLAQMTAAGLRIVHTPGEVCFVQNLVYYLAEVYRTPDYGIWERGNKRNEGVAEINASSLGMAKAALEAISGVRFLPAEAPAIHVVADDIARARNTLANLLPRESLSKEIDAALLAVIGFPAFAVEDAALVARTRAEIVGKLQGRYGCKRFLRDGHQTVVEDTARMHYEPGELARFENIESEWPLFFTYLLIDAALSGDAEPCADYRARLDRLMQERDGQRLLPELYFVPADRVEAEREQPHSQARQPNDNVPLVWAQSLYLVGVLLQEGYIAGEDVDPLGLRQRAQRLRDVEVQVLLLAEDTLTQSRLAAFGIAAETLDEVAPTRVESSQELGTALAQLGRCEALGLSGRPPLPLGSLATAQVFELGGATLVFLPSLFNRERFYLTLDNRLLVDEVAAEIAHVRRHWREDREPLLALLIGEEMLDARGADVLVESLQKLVQEGVEGVAVSRLADVLDKAARTTIDWTVQAPAAHPVAAEGEAVDAVLDWEEAATRPLTAERADALAHAADNDALAAHLARSRNPYEQMEILGLLLQRGGPDAAIPVGGSVRQLVAAMYSRAARTRTWGVLRHAAGLLDLFDESLEETVALIVAHQKRISVGSTESADAIIDRPCGNDDIVARIRRHGGDDPRGRALIQEVMLYTGTLMKADPALFKGMLTLRAWHLVQLVTGWLAREHGLTTADAFDHLLTLSPHAILGRLREVITREREMTASLVKQRRWKRAGKTADLVRVSFAASDDPSLDEGEGGWAAWREMSGVISRRPEHFYVRVRQLVGHCRGLVIGNALDSRNCLDSAIVRADTTPGERTFALQLEELLARIQEPAYRQLTVEALNAAADIVNANRELQIDSQLVIDELLATAVALHWRQLHGQDAPAEEGEPIESHAVAHAWQSFYALEPHALAEFIMSAFALLLREHGEEPG